MRITSIIGLATGAIALVSVVVVLTRWASAATSAPAPKVPVPPSQQKVPGVRDPADALDTDISEVTADKSGARMGWTLASSNATWFATVKGRTGPDGKAYPDGSAGAWAAWWAESKAPTSGLPVDAYLGLEMVGSVRRVK